MNPHGQRTTEVVVDDDDAADDEGQFPVCSNPFECSRDTAMPVGQTMITLSHEQEQII